MFLILCFIILILTVRYINIYAIEEPIVIKVAGDMNHPPYEFIDNQGIYKGFNIDIMRAIAIEMGLDIEIIPMAWKDALDALRNGDVDLIQGISRNQEREKEFYFLSPTVENSHSIFVRQDTTYISQLEDLSGITVAIQEGDINNEIIKSIPNVVVISKKDQREAIDALILGEVEAFVGNTITAKYYLQRTKQEELVKIVGEPMAITEYGPATLIGNNIIYSKINEGLKAIEKNGTYDKIYEKWFGGKVLGGRAIMRAYLRERAMIISSILATLLLVLLWNKKLKKEVSKRTAELESVNKDLMIQEAKAYDLAYYDPITGLPNKLYFMKKLDVAIKESKTKGYKVAVLCLDLDRFKQINDTLGHNVGDMLLRAVGERIGRLILEPNLISRIGGDEFFILIKDIKTEEETGKICKSILEELKRPFSINSYDLYINTSIGVSLYPEGGEDTSSLMKNADTAMYMAKDGGGNGYYIYNISLSQSHLSNLIIANKLQKAIEKRELCLYYQPKIDIFTGKVVGAEALLRWFNDELGSVSPVQFIPIAEETGLILPIGEWVLIEACKQHKEWQNIGLEPIVISVNISAKQFQHQDLVKIVSRILKETEVYPHYLELEITESTAVVDINYTIDILDRLKEIGVHISIDDFGTGYSSLNYLKEMNVDELKIDKSFICDINSNPKNKAIAKTIILLAHELGLNVTAEGVESREHLEILRENKCNKAQGYYYSPPIKATEFEEFIRNYNRDYRN